MSINQLSFNKSQDPFSLKLKDLCFADGRSWKSTAAIMGMPPTNLQQYVTGDRPLPANRFQALLDISGFDSGRQATLWEQYDLYCQRKTTAISRSVEGSYNFRHILDSTYNPLTFIQAALALSGQSVSFPNCFMESGWKEAPLVCRQNYLELINSIEWPATLREHYVKRAKKLYDLNFTQKIDRLHETDDYKGMLKLCRLRKGSVIKKLAGDLSVTVSLLYRDEDSRSTRHHPTLQRLKFLIESYHPPVAVMFKLLSAYGNKLAESKDGNLIETAHAVRAYVSRRGSELLKQDAA